MPRRTSTKSKLVEVPRINNPAGEYIDFPLVGPTAPYKPNKQYFVEALSEGEVVGIHRKQEYPTFFKLFERYNEKHGLKQKLYIRRSGESLWLLLARKASDPKPGNMLDGDFCEHGRYKWYAGELENEGLSKLILTWRHGKPVGHGCSTRIRKNGPTASV